MIYPDDVPGMNLILRPHPALGIRIVGSQCLCLLQRFGFIDDDRTRAIAERAGDYNFALAGKSLRIVTMQRSDRLRFLRIGYVGDEVGEFHRLSLCSCTYAGETNSCAAPRCGWRNG